MTEHFGHVKKSSVLTGAAGEHYVLFRLLRMGLLAGLPPTGAPDVDILIIDESAKVVTSLQVKTRRKGADKGWHMRAKHETLVSDRLFYVFVDMEPVEPVSYVIPSAVVADVVTKENASWLRAPGKKGQAHNQTDMRRVQPKYSYSVEGFPDGWMEEYREAWSLISTP